MSINKPIAESGILSVVSDSDALVLIEFFLYYAAPRGISPLSLDLPRALSGVEKDDLLNELCDEAKCERSDLCFPTLRNGRTNEISRLNLTDERFVVDGAKGFFLLNVPNGKGAPPEDEFDCIIRHIRNSIAHGRVCAVNDYGLFEDIKNNLTMRFVVKPQALINWVSRIQERFDS